MMEEFISYLENYTVQVLMVISSLQFLLIVGWIVNRIKLKKMIKKYEGFLKGTEKNNLEEILLDHLSKVEQTQEVLKKQSEELRRLEKGAANCIQKVYTKRYNAFDNTGNDLSYSTALLDAHNSGFVLTGIYGRDYAVSYSKPIEGGKAKNVLSTEENEALQAAMNQKTLIRP